MVECCQEVHGTCKALAGMMRSLNCQVFGLHVSDVMSQLLEIVEFQTHAFVCFEDLIVACLLAILIVG